MPKFSVWIFTSSHFFQVLFLCLIHDRGCYPSYEYKLHSQVKKEKNRERQEIKRKENMYKKHSRKFMNQLKTRTGLMYGSITTGDDSPMLFPKPNMKYDSNWYPDQFQQEWDEEMDTYYREQETSRIFRDGQGEFLDAELCHH